MFEEIDKESIPVPEIQTNISPKSGSEVESIDVVAITFLGAGNLKVNDVDLIKMRDESREKVFPLQKVTTKGNRVDLDFGSLPEGSYMLIVSEGAFTYTFADVDRKTEAVYAMFTVTQGMGITNIRVEDSDEPLFDLQGRKVSGNLKSGIYIKNGKKVYIK